MADDETRTNAESGELFAPPGPRRASYTPPANDEAARLAAAKVFTDDAIAEALAAEFATFDPRPTVGESARAESSDSLEPVAQSAPSPDLPPPLYLGAPAPTVPPVDAPPPPGYEHAVATPAETVEDEVPPEERLRDRSAREFTAWEASMLEDGSPDALASLAQARREEPDFRFASEVESEPAAATELPRVEPAIELASEAPTDEQVEPGVLDFHFADFDFPPPVTPKTLPSPDAAETAAEPTADVIPEPTSASSPESPSDLEPEQSTVQFPGFAPPSHEPFPGFAPHPPAATASPLPTEPPSTPPVIPAYTPEPPSETVSSAAQFPPLLDLPATPDFPPPLVEPPTSDSRPEPSSETPTWDFVLPASPVDAVEAPEPADPLFAEPSEQPAQLGVPERGENVARSEKPEPVESGAQESHGQERPEFDALLTGPAEPLSSDYALDADAPGHPGETFVGVEALGLGAPVTPSDGTASIDPDPDHSDPDSATQSPSGDDEAPKGKRGSAGPFWRRRRSS